MKFKKWIELQGGPKALARKLGTESPTVYAWLRGAASPKALTMQKIVKMSRGALSYDDIIDATKGGAQ